MWYVFIILDNFYKQNSKSQKRGLAIWYFFHTQKLIMKLDKWYNYIFGETVLLLSSLAFNNAQ